MSLKDLVNDIHSLRDVEALKNRLSYYNEQYSRYATLILETENRIEELEEKQR